MIELQLVGYTADLEYLVFCDAKTGASRFKAAVDDDLVATFGELVERTDPARRAVLFPAPPSPPAVPAPALAPPPPPPPPPPPAPQRTGAAIGKGPLAAVALLPDGLDQQPVAGDATTADRGSRLSPREIQALLRAGRAPSAVARDAQIDEEWVQRWLPPIEAERERIIRAVRAATLSKSRLGPSDLPLGEAVDANLGSRVRGEDPVEWSAARRDGDPYWTVAVRYRSRGRWRRARWLYDPDSREVRAQDKVSLELGWSRTGPAAQESTVAASTPRRPRGAKKAPAKKTTNAAAPVTKTAAAASPPAKKAANKRAASNAAPRTAASTRGPRASRPPGGDGS